MEKEECYNFYLETCVDEDKGEIPLSFEEWEKEIYPKDKAFLEELRSKELI